MVDVSTAPTEVPAEVPAAAPVAVPTAAPVSKPKGLKPKAADLGLKIYLKAPAPTQTLLLNGFLKVQPIAAKVAPHGKKLVGGAFGLALLGQLRRRGR